MGIGMGMDVESSKSNRVCVSVGVHDSRLFVLDLMRLTSALGGGRLISGLTGSRVITCRGVGDRALDLTPTAPPEVQ